MSLTIADHILFAVLAFVLPAFAVIRVRKQVLQIPDESAVKIRLYWINSAVLWAGALVVMLVWLFSKRGFAEMGWQLLDQTWFPEWVIVVWVFLLIWMFDTFVAWNSIDDNPAAALLPAKWIEFAHFGTVVSLSAGICEEIVFRGFLINYLIAVLPASQWNAALAIGISSLIFAVLHAYQGFWATVKITVLAILFGMIFVLTESLIAVIILHFLVDFVGGLVALIANQREEEVQF